MIKPKYDIQTLALAVSNNVILRKDNSTNYAAHEIEENHRLAMALMMRLMLQFGYTSNQVETELSVGPVMFEDVEKYLTHVLQKPEANMNNRKFHTKLNLAHNYLKLNHG